MTDQERLLDGQHPNLDVIIEVGSVILSGFTASHEHLFADDFVFHYFNRRLPDVNGDYHGVEGMRRFFTRLGDRTEGTFHIEPVSLTPFGDELVAAHATITLTLEGTDLELDSLVVWRVFDGQVHEAWDIPATNTVRQPSGPGPSNDPSR